MGRDSNKVTISFSGLFLPMLAILFIGLKLTDNIDWPWVWVLAPIWLPIALIVAMILIILPFALRR